MKKKELIEKCRYYHGESKSPFEDDNDELSQFWYYELCWVDFLTQNPDRLNFEISEYRKYGLSDFSSDDGTPLSLKALLFNRFIHRDNQRIIDEPVIEFKKFYLNNYLKNIK